MSFRDSEVRASQQAGQASGPSKSYRPRKLNPEALNPLFLFFQQLFAGAPGPQRAASTILGDGSKPSGPSSVLPRRQGSRKRRAWQVGRSKPQNAKALSEAELQLSDEGGPEARSAFRVQR